MGTSGTPVNGSSVSLGYLLPYLRLRVGDTNPEAYRYLDAWLMTSLQLAMTTLQRYNNFKYLIDSTGVITRNPLSLAFVLPETYGVIEQSDINIIVLLAAIIVLEGSLENSAWNATSWKDYEVAFSNLEQFRTRNETLKRMIEELNSLIKPPVKRLALPQKQSLPGYLNNQFEYKD